MVITSYGGGSGYCNTGKDYNKGDKGDREMKEYEKWRKETNPRYNSPAVFYAMERSWKAALEWALKNLEESYEKLASGDMGWEGGFIEDELNAKT